VVGCTLRLLYHKIKVKVKVKQSHYRPGQARRVLRKLRFPDFVTTAQDGGRLSALRTGRLYSWYSWYSFLLEAESRPQGHSAIGRILCQPAGIEPATFRFVAQHLNHCATAVLRFFIRGNRYILWVGGRRCWCEREAGRNTHALTRSGIPVVHPLASHYTD